ncbi:hypothetical protein Goshw_014717 [Gossypium schwendimanii]|uniref:Uncharacterized protein n=1 Tax=Gossypium schwendimanii TaxID=34291 RepID=A0A7J9MHI8_GOSSC|nr:hypothetical protein [Gossypium schwendimanii]
MAKHLGFFVFLIVVLIFSNFKRVECGILKRVHRRGGYANLATLGVVCKCCDGEGGECRSSRDASYSCPKLKCLPWKYQ